MASDRQANLAALLAAGWPCEAATAVEAGWPETTAVWLGPNAVEYLRKAGIEVQATGQAVEVASGDIPPVVEFVPDPPAPEPEPVAASVGTKTNRPYRRKGVEA